MIVGIGGDKGGCGKTTLATNIAAMAATRGLKVGLLDADGRKPDSFGWYERRCQLAVLPQVSCKRVMGAIDDSIGAMAEDNDFLVIDTGGMDSVEMRYAAAYSDVFLAPFNPGRYDLDTAQKVSSIIALARPVNPNLRSYSVLIGVSNHPNSRSTLRARESLNTVRGLACLNSVLHYLEAWKETADTGRGVCEVQPQKAHHDLVAVTEEAQLWQENS